MKNYPFISFVISALLLVFIKISSSFNSTLCFHILIFFVILFSLLSLFLTVVYWKKHKIIYNVILLLLNLILIFICIIGLGFVNCIRLLR